MGCLPFVIGIGVGLLILAFDGPGVAALVMGIVSAAISWIAIKQHHMSATTTKAKPIRFEPISPSEILTETPTDIEGVNDAFTGEPLDTSLEVYQCSVCQACYSEDTLNFLRKENGGKCINYSFCRGTEFVPVTKTNGKGRGRNFAPSVVTLRDYRIYVGHVVTFEGYVHRVLPSQSGHSLAIMFEDASWTRGLKAVVLGPYITDAGGRRYLNSLPGRIVRVCGLLQEHPHFGHQILITKKPTLVDT